MLNKEVITKILKNNLEFIQDNFQVANIGIFGSYIREEATEESDIDLLVEFDKGHKDHRSRDGFMAKIGLTRKNSG